MRVLALGVLASCLTANVAFAVDVTACGQVVAANEVGSLTGYLDCSAAAAGSKAVSLGNRATLELNGNTIVAPPAGFAVSCDSVRRCTVTGPGFLMAAPPVNPVGVGIASDGDVVVDGSIEIYRHETGILAADGKVTISNVILRKNADGIIAKVVRGGGGVFVLESTRVGIKASKKVQGGPYEIRDSGWAGIETMKFKLDGLSATTNGFDGTTSGGGVLATKRGVLRNSHVTANALNGVPADLVTGRRPVLIDSNCSASVMLIDGLPSGTWGVCVTD